MPKVNDQSDVVKKLRLRWDLVDALMGGTWAMREKGDTYLHRWPRETQISYDYRLKTSTLFNAFARTVENMASKPFSEPLKWTDIDPTVEGWFDNIDLQGQNLQTFAHDVFRAGLTYGLTHVLIDYPRTVTSDGTLLAPTLADERAMGARPYAVHLPPTSILGWISEKIGGVETLTQLRISECVTEPDGDFATKDVKQVRVLTPGAFQIYRMDGKSQDWALYEEGTTSLGFIPLVTFYARRTGFMTGTPPLADLADLNVQHWNSSSDQYALLHVARVPIFAIIGGSEEDDIEVGAKSALKLPVGSDAKYIEHSGEAIGAGRTSLQDLEEQMRTMGAELLVAQPGDMTATQSSIDTAQAQCQLSEMAGAFEDVLDQMIDIMAAWAGLGDQGDVDVFDDFAESPITGANVGPFVAALVTMVASDLISRETAFEEVKRYGIINPDLDWEVERAKIGDTAPALQGEAMKLDDQAA